MDIEAEHGHKVVFTHPTYGYKPHQDQAEKYLEVNETYTVDYTDISSCHTDVYLVEYPSVAFNAVMFDDFEYGIVADLEDIKIPTAVDAMAEAMQLIAASEGKRDDMLDVYVKAINKIDDYFEYGDHSEKDKKFVMAVIDDITKQLKDLKN